MTSSPRLSLIGLLLRWLGLTLAIFVAAHLPFLGITYQSLPMLLLAALMLGLLNAFVRPLLFLVSLPLIVLTLGLFIWVVNACLLLLVSALMGAAFVVPGFFSALGGSLVISLVSLFLPGGRRKRNHVNVQAYRSGGRQPPPDHRQPPPGKGPVIDI